MYPGMRSTDSPPGSSDSYVTSAAGMAGVRNNAAYAAAKAAQISLIRGAAAEFEIEVCSAVPYSMKQSFFVSQNK